MVRANKSEPKWAVYLLGGKRAGRLGTVTAPDRDAAMRRRTVDVHVGRLRRAFNRSRASDPIRTVRGTGYSFDERFGKDERLSKSA